MIGNARTGVWSARLAPRSSPSKNVKLILKNAIKFLIRIVAPAAFWSNLPRPKTISENVQKSKFIALVRIANL